MNQTHAKEVVSPSLIATSPKPGLSKTDHKRFCLGLPDWCPYCMSDTAENAPPHGAAESVPGEEQRNPTKANS